MVDFPEGGTEACATGTPTLCPIWHDAYGTARLQVSALTLGALPFNFRTFRR